MGLSVQQRRVGNP